LRQQQRAVRLLDTPRRDIAEIVATVSDIGAGVVLDFR
jgi:hypothetical protein